MHYLQVVYHISHFSTIEEGFLLEALSSLMEKKRSAATGQTSGDGALVLLAKG